MVFSRMWKPCRKKKHEPKPGEILDQVISQSSASASKCLLYKLANYKRGGDLIDALQMGTQISVEQLIREQFGIFMYNNGKGQIINRAEYLRWKYMDNVAVVIPIEASLSPHDPLGKWVDHKACWQMQYRGSLGESLLHVLIICDTKQHTKLARLLLRVFPELAIDVMEGEEYLGASALHLAIAYSNNELVQDLIEAGANVSQRAIGSFFLPRDQQGYKRAKTTDYEGLAYMGEYPLAWAACCANESVYNLLIDHNADPDAQDTFGNMILHMVVVCDKLDMFGYALRHPRTPARNGIANYNGLTPLTLACKLGRAEVFREMLELSAREFWRYSNITCSGYPLNALDTILPDGRTNWNSALFIILNGTKEAHLDMLDGGIIQRLLEEKWKTFARKQFLKRLLILVTHLFCLSSSIYLRPATKNMAKMEQSEDPPEEVDPDAPIEVRTIIRYISEICTILGVLSYVIIQQGDEVKNQGLAAFLKQLAATPAKAIFLISNFMILACIPFRIIGDIDTEEAILVFAVPGSWFLLMFFAGAVRLTGPFVTMIFSMLTGDMFTFGIIYSIVLMGFSQAFFFLYKGHANRESTPFHSYPATWMGLFQTTLGDYSYPDMSGTTYPNLAKTVFVIFMIFVPILLLNMLIAMMGNTYARVIEQSEKEWMKQWAKIVVNLERAVSAPDAKKYLEEYSIGLGPSQDDSGYEQRGVMVIKSKSKTRAKQRKGAVTNWKHVGRVTLNELKKRGMTGEELRRIMWGRASISTPTKVTKKKRQGDPYGITPATTTPTTNTGAIGSALDVMNFTTEIIVGEEIKGNQKPSPNVLHSTQFQSTDSSKYFLDPLRELVLISEAILTPDMNNTTKIKTLANAATVLDNVKEINVGQGISAAKPSPIQSYSTQPIPKTTITTPNSSLKPQAAAAPNMAASTLFQNPADIIDPEKEKLFLKKLEAIEDTDSEGVGDRPVLGKISLMRRAKSAVARTPSGKKKSDKHPLFAVAWDEIKVKNKEMGITNDAFERDQEMDDEIVTVEEVKRKMELLHLQRKSSPDSDSTSEHNITIKPGDESKGKYSRARRMTGKTPRNKVSPEVKSHTDKRGKSAPIPKEHPPSPPDPLEPWSTRDIVDLNKILDS